MTRHLPGYLCCCCWWWWWRWLNTFWRSVLLLLLLLLATLADCLPAKHHLQYGAGQQRTPALITAILLLLQLQLLLLCCCRAPCLLHLRRPGLWSHQRLILQPCCQHMLHSTWVIKPVNCLHEGLLSSPKQPIHVSSSRRRRMLSCTLTPVSAVGVIFLVVIAGITLGSVIH